MNTSQKWVLALGVASVFGLVCQGQVAPARGPNAGPSLTITGTVFNPSGAPAAGVVLMLVPPSPGRNAQITSDADGKYTFTWQQRAARGGMAAPTYSLIARDLEHNFAVAHTVDEATSSLDLHLQPGLTISATMQGPDGKPIPNATGNLIIYSGNTGTTMNRPPANLINADDQGRIQFTALPQGFRYSATFRAAGYGSSGTQTIQEADTHTTHVDLPTVTLKLANLDLAGQVLGADGNPAAGARVFVSGLGQPTTNIVSDSTGHFTAKVCEGAVTVSANLQGANGNERVVGGDTKVVIRLRGNNNGGNADIVDIVGQRPRVNNHTITGTVFTPSGAPAPGVDLSIMPGGGGPNQESKSDDAGKYTFTWQQRAAREGIAAPTYSLIARDLEHNFAVAHTVDEATSSLDLHLQPGLTISATVQGPDGKPIPNANGTMSIFSGNSGMVINRPPANNLINADDQGRIQFTALPQGFRYSATFRAAGYGSSGTQTIQEADTHTTHFDLPTVVLKVANLDLAGQVLGADGNPAAGVRVLISGVGQPTTNVVSDSTGHFAFKVCEGEVNVNANMQGANGNARAVGGDTKVVIRLRGNNNGADGVGMVVGQITPVSSHTITGTVFTPSGAPAPGVDLSIMPGGGGPNQESKSDASGKFTLSWRPIQFGGNGNGPTVNYSLMGRDQEHNFAATVGIDEGTRNIDLHLKGGLTLSGVVQDNNGAPVTTATIRLMMMTPPVTTMFNQQPATVDKDGAFSFVALPQGQAYNLNVMSPGFGQASVQASPDQTQTAILQLPAIKLLPADQRLEGKVVGPDDKPVAGARVFVSGPGQPNANIISDSAGHFAFKVCEGMVRLTANLQPSAAMRNGGAATPGALQFLSGNIQAQSGDLNVVLKLAERQTIQQAMVGGAQAQPRRVPLREPIWSWDGLLDWPGDHSQTVTILLIVQLTAIIGTTAGILWVTRQRRH